MLVAMAAGGVAYVASALGYGLTAARYFSVQVPLFVTVVGATTTRGRHLGARGLVLREPPGRVPLARSCKPWEACWLLLRCRRQTRRSEGSIKNA